MRLLAENSKLASTVRLAIVAAFALATALAGVFSMPPLDRDESRFAQASVQMLETGDFISIRFQGDERNKKPAGIHWLQAASVSAFSSAEAREIWAYRLPSVAGAVIAALFTYLAGVRLFGPATGFLAALLLASAPAVAGEAMIAKTDAMLLACVTAAETSFIHVFGAAIEGRRARPYWPLIFWLSLGAGALIKGPIILMVIGLTALSMFALRPRTDWIAALRPIGGLLILVLMIAPWAFAINHATEGRFFVEAVGGDMLAKLGDAKERHGGPPGYYSVLLFVLLWPAAALVLPGLRAAYLNRALWQSQFLFAWAAPAWIVFELTATKLPHYTLPLYPAIALMAAHGAISGAASQWPRLRRIGAGFHAAVGLAIAALVAALPVIYQDAPLRPYCFAAGSALGLASVAVSVMFWRGRAIEGAVAAALVSSALAWTMLDGALPRLDRLALSPRLSAAIDAASLHPLRDGAHPSVLSGYYEPSAIFLLGTDTILANGRDAADHFADAGRAAVIEAREEAVFLGRLKEKGILAQKFAQIEGVNYSNGKDVRLSIYRRLPSAPSVQDAR